MILCDTNILIEFYNRKGEAVSLSLFLLLGEIRFLPDVYATAQNYASIE